MKCLDCRKEFLVPKKLALHIEYFHKKPNYFVCPFEKCHRFYHRKTDFQKHINKKHLSKTISNSERQAKPIIDSKNETLMRENDIINHISGNNCKMDLCTTENETLTCTEKADKHYNLFKNLFN